MEKCLECGREFQNMNSLSRHIGTHMTQEQYFNKYLRTSEQEGKCIICGKPTRFRNFHYSECCSQSCRNKWIDQNRTEEQKLIRGKNISKANTSEMKEKRKQTNIDRYGVPYTTQNKEVQEKRTQTCLKKYGVAYSWQAECVKAKIQDSIHTHYGELGLRSQEIKNKKRKTCQERYGTNNQAQVESVKEKIKSTCIERYGVEYSFQSDKVINNIKQTKEQKLIRFCQENNCIPMQELIKRYGTGWAQNGNIVIPIKFNKDIYCIKNEDIPKIEQYFHKMQNFHSSNQQEFLVNYIKSFYTGIIEINKKAYIYPYELDIYLPELKIAIEYNGIYWHSIQHGIALNYHLDKSIACRNKGIRLIHIYEFEDMPKQYHLLKDLILGIDNYPKDDFNKNNLIDTIPNPEIIYNNNYIIYGAGKLK